MNRSETVRSGVQNETNTHVLIICKNIFELAFELAYSRHQCSCGTPDGLELLKDEICSGLHIQPLMHAWI
jgi:hypothetical protein